MTNAAGGDGVRIGADVLRDLMTDVFLALDVLPDDVRMVVDAMMEATLAGYDSHGVMRLARYVNEVQRGLVDGRGQFRIVRETAASAFVDGGRALGAVTATRAVELACAKAAEVGIGCVSTVNSTDIGRLGSYLWQPALQGFLTLLVVNDSGGLPTVAPFGGATRFFSTNPFGAGIPREVQEPIIIDMSSSMTSVGRLRMDARRGAMVPEGWLIDEQGEAVLDPARFFEEPEKIFLLPLGGMLAGHKGFALQLLIDVLSGAVGGAGVATGVDPGIEANAIFTLALDPEFFAGRERFAQLVEAQVAGLKQAKRLPGVDAIRLPGERAARERERRQREGIVLHPKTRDEVMGVVGRLGLAERYRSSLQ